MRNSSEGRKGSSNRSGSDKKRFSTEKGSFKKSSREEGKSPRREKGTSGITEFNRRKESSRGTERTEKRSYSGRDAGEKRSFERKESSFSEKKSSGRYSDRTESKNFRSKDSGDYEGGENRGKRTFGKYSESNNNGFKKSYSDSDKRRYKSEGNYREKSFDKENNFRSRDKKDFRKYSDNEERPRRSSEDNYEKKGPRKFTDKTDRPGRKTEGSYERRGSSNDEREYRKPRGYSERKDEGRSYSSRAVRSTSRREDSSFDSDRPKREEQSFDRRPSRKSYERKSDSVGERKFTRRDSENFDKKNYSDRPSRGRKSTDDFVFGERDAEKDFRGSRSRYPVADSSFEKSNYKEKRPRAKRSDIELARKVKEKEKPDGKLIRLNKYLSNAGVCSRREADDLIVSGSVTVNGKTITELGYKVSLNDDVAYGGAPIKREKKVYVLLNKPKDFITTMEDEKGRRTVMELVQNAGRERIFPVGRLDRNTTGLLLFTNDGEMALKLTHPKHQVQKLYHVVLNMKLRLEDMEAIKAGVELEDGLIKPDKLEFADDGANKKEIGIEIHSGKNRIVRRIFEKFGYEIVKLDRVMFASLTKKDIPRGRWRFLTEKEINFLKMI